MKRSTVLSLLPQLVFLASSVNVNAMLLLLKFSLYLNSCFVFVFDSEKTVLNESSKCSFAQTPLVWKYVDQVPMLYIKMIEWGDKNEQLAAYKWILTTLEVLLLGKKEN